MPVAVGTQIGRRDPFSAIEPVLRAHSLGGGVQAAVIDVHAEATSVQFPGLDGVVPGFGMQRPNDWGLGFEIRDGKSPHWTGSRNSAATYGHFGQTGTFLWVDPSRDIALVVLTDRDFGDWAKPLWPALSDAVVSEFNSD